MPKDPGQFNWATGCKHSFLCITRYPLHVVTCCTVARKQGIWRLGLPEGPGRYKWATGCEYDGEWKAGYMHGKGTYVWPSGHKFDGEWKVGGTFGEGVGKVWGNACTARVPYVWPSGTSLTASGRWVIGVVKLWERWEEGVWGNGACMARKSSCGLLGHKFDGEWKVGGRCGERVGRTACVSRERT